MRSDDELLGHIRQQAGIRRVRRQRLVAAGATAAVVGLLGIGAVAATAGTGASDQVQAGEGDPTTSTTDATSTTTEAPPTTVGPTSTEVTTTTSTTAPPVDTTAPPPAPTTTEAAPPPTTAPAPIAPVSETAVSDDLVLTATATQDRARPGWVEVTVHVTAGHGSGPSGGVQWTYGEGEPEYYGVWAPYLPTSCDEQIDDDPETQIEPDPSAGPVDETFTFAHQYGTDLGRVAIGVDVMTSFCTTDWASAAVVLEVDLAA